MVRDGEPAYKRPCCLCIGVDRDKGVPIYAEGFGEWMSEAFPVFGWGDDSDGESGFEVRFWWEWDIDSVLAEELQMAEEEEYWQEEALRDWEEEAEHLRHLIAAGGLVCDGSQGA